MTEGTINRQYVAYGGAAEFFRCENKEVLCESGAGTGKTYSLMHKANWTARAYAGCRQVFARVSRKSLNDSVLPEWEDKVLYRGHPAITGTAGPAHRETYTYPNGSVIVLHSLDHVDRILSSQHDRIYIFQAEELLDPSVWEKLLTRLRNGKTPYGQIVADVNPAAEGHWLNRRAETKICEPCFLGVSREMGVVVEMNEDHGAPVCPECHSMSWRYQMRRIRYRHEDNPRWYDHEAGEWTEDGKEYIGRTLGLLKGVQRERLLKHRWVSEEGVVLDEWDAKTHLIDAKLFGPGQDPVEPGSPYWRLHVKGWEKPVTLLWFGAGMDWGFYPDPGALTVWGYDDRGRRFMVTEVCKTRWQIETWADCAYELKKLFDIKYFACDPSRPDNIEAFNIRMTSRFGRSGGAMAIKADNTLRAKAKAPGKDLVGIDLMRHGLRTPDGEVLTYVVRNATPMGIDSTLRKEGRTVCLAEEVTRWTWARNTEGKAKNTPDQGCDDHLLDSWRYEQSVGWLRRGHKIEGKKRHSPTSYRSLIWANSKKK